MSGIAERRIVMKESYLDKAFDWLVVLLGTITATICQFPELLPLYRPDSDTGAAAVVRLTIFPVLVLVLLWLAGSLARGSRGQVFWRSLSWMYASLILAADIVLLLMGSVPLIQRAYEAQEVGVLQSTVMLELVMAVPFYLLVIRPRMREVYEESKLVRSLAGQLLVALLGVVLYVVAVGFVEAGLGVGPF